MCVRACVRACVRVCVCVCTSQPGNFTGCGSEGINNEGTNPPAVSEWLHGDMSVAVVLPFKGMAFLHRCSVYLPLAPAG